MLRYSSVQRFSNQFGVLAERLDEIGAQVFGVDVEAFSSPAPSPRPVDVDPVLPEAHHQAKVIPYSVHIVHADGEITAKPGIHSLPTELLHLIVLHMQPDVDTIHKIGSINKYVTIASKARFLLVEEASDHFFPLPFSSVVL